jgi:hypothetical protein
LYRIRNFPQIANPLAPYAAGRGAAAKHVPACLPNAGKVVPATPNWLHEVKHDRYRLIVQRDGSLLGLDRIAWKTASRSGSYCTAQRHWACAASAVRSLGDARRQAARRFSTLGSRFRMGASTQPDRGLIVFESDPIQGRHLEASGKPDTIDQAAQPVY